MSKVSIEGLPDLMRKLNDMGKIDKDAIKKIIKSEGQQIIDTAKVLAAKHTGELARSIGFIEKNEARYPTTVLIGPDYKIAPHAHLIEFGTKERFRGDKVFFKQIRSLRRAGVSERTLQRTIEANKDLHSTGVGPMRPFMRPAFDRNAAEVDNGISQKVFRLILKQAKKNKLI